MPKDMRTWIRELENAGDVAATCSASELTFIVIMASNPEPSYRVAFQITQSTTEPRVRRTDQMRSS